MRMLLAVLFVCFCVVSCQEEIFPTGYETQIVLKGAHYCNNSSTVYKYTGRVFCAVVKLDTSLFVHNEDGFQSKLLGFSEDQQVQYNSARVSFHTISDPTDSLKDVLVFKTYVYNNSTRLTDLESNKELFRISYSDVLAGLGHDSIKFEIEMTSDKYVFKVNDGYPVSISRVGKLHLDSPKYVLKLYYGGNPVAPHDMYMRIKYDPCMRGVAQSLYTTGGSN